MKNKTKNQPAADKWTKRDDPDMLGWERETHPSYGVIGVSRVSGNSPLFNSETKHLHYIAIRIKEACRVIDGTREFVNGDNKLCEVFMTEAQFAQFITQPNQGDGVPCTIHYSAGDVGQPWLTQFGTRPDAPMPERFEMKFHKEASDRAKIISDNLAEVNGMLTKLLDGSERTNKTTLTNLKKQIESAQRQIDSNIPYVLEVAAEQLERKMASAVIEFEGYVSQSLQAKGLGNLSSEAPRLDIADRIANVPLLGGGDTTED